MSTTDTPDSSGEPKAEPDSSSAAEPQERGQESWLDRLKVAVGLKPQGTIREEIAEALAADDAVGGFSPEERPMLANILELREVRVEDVMVPRADIDAAEIDISLGDLFASFEKSGHSRMPVYRETLDDPVGFVHIKDLIGYAIEGARTAPRDGQPSPEPAGAEIDLRKVDLTRPLAKSGILRNILFVPPSMPVTALLAKMQASRMQLALGHRRVWRHRRAGLARGRRRDDRRRHRGRARRRRRPDDRSRRRGVLPRRRHAPRSTMCARRSAPTSPTARMARTSTRSAAWSSACSGVSRCAAS